MSNFPRKVNKKRGYRKYRKGKKQGKGLNKVQKLQIEKMITSVPEKKYYDYGFNGIGISSTPAFYDLISPLQDLTSDGAIGNQIRLLSLQFNLQFVLSDATNWIRMVIFQWYDDTTPTGAVTTNAVPVWNRIFQFANGAGGTPIDQYERMSPYLVGTGRGPIFKVLKDEQFTLDVDNPQQLFKGFINKGYRKEIGLNYSIVIPSGVNKIWVMLVSDSAAAPNPTITGNFRSRFIDS